MRVLTLLTVFSTTLLSQSPKVMMPEDLFRRNIGTKEQLNTLVSKTALK
jgi:hypothetical protein